MAPRSTRLIIALTTVWLCGVASGLYVLWAYDNKPGVSAVAPARWPATSGLVPSTSGPTLLLRRASAVHLHARQPRRARRDSGARGHAAENLHPVSETVDGSTRLGTDRPPANAPPRCPVSASSATMTASKHSASACRRPDRRFFTTATARCVFSGGITGSRGHAGENAGELSLISLLSHSNTTDRRATSVFGCPLFAKAD